MNKYEVTTIVGIVSTLVAGLAIVGWLLAVTVYNNNQNIKRDEFIASHCSQMDKVSDNSTNPPTVHYKCGQR